MLSVRLTSSPYNTISSWEAHLHCDMIDRCAGHLAVREVNSSHRLREEIQFNF